MNKIQFTNNFSREVLKKIILLDISDPDEDSRIVKEMGDLSEFQADKIAFLPHPGYNDFVEDEKTLLVEIGLWDSSSEDFNKNKEFDISYFVETVINDKFSYYGDKISNSHSFPYVEFHFDHILDSTEVKYFTEYLKNSFDKALEAV